MLYVFWLLKEPQFRWSPASWAAQERVRKPSNRLIFRLQASKLNPAWTEDGQTVSLSQLGSAVPRPVTFPKQKTRSIVMNGHKTWFTSVGDKVGRKPSPCSGIAADAL